jgi:uncharacterized BrkB/YihY/UPF0761 family membrane protein
MFIKFGEMIDNLVKILSGGVSNLLMSVAFIAFLCAIINYIWKRRQGESEGMKQAGNILFGSVFALFVMVAVWGMVNFIGTNLLGDDYKKNTIEKPQTMWNITAPKK